MRRSTVLMLAGAIGAALFTYTPTAAQWIALGRDTGTIPAEVPTEATDPPAVAGAVLTLFVTACVMLFRWLYSRSGASPIVVAVAAQAIEEQIAGQGRALIANRTRRQQIAADIATAEAERADAVCELRSIEKQVIEGAALIDMARTEAEKTRNTLAEQEAELDALTRDQLATERRARGLVDRTYAITAAMSELEEERRALTGTDLQDSEATKLKGGPRWMSR